MSPAAIPEKKQWETEADVACYVYECIKALDLDTWRFEWEKTIRRMGCCKYGPHIVLLSIHYVRKYLELDPRQIQRTILHELAHALAWEYDRASGHDATWHAFCRALGIGDEKACSRVESFTPEGHPSLRKRFVLYHLETGEVFKEFSRYPSRTAEHIRQVYIPGRMSETLGKLGIRFAFDPDAPPLAPRQFDD